MQGTALYLTLEGETYTEPYKHTKLRYNQGKNEIWKHSFDNSTEFSQLSHISSIVALYHSLT